MSNKAKLPEPQRAARDAKVVELRLHGYGFREIGEIVGISTQRAQQILAEFHAKITDEDTGTRRRQEIFEIDAEEERVREILRKPHFKVSASGKIIYDPETKQPLVDASAYYQGVATLVRLKELRAKLMGLAMPTQVEMKVTADVLNPQVADWIEAARARREGDVVDGEVVEDGPNNKGGPDTRAAEIEP